MLSRERHELEIGLGLAAVAGFVDSVGFLALGGFFLSFMTGNTTRAAVELAAGHFGAALIGPAIIAAFVIGVIAGSVVGDVAGTRRKSTVLVLVAGFLVFAGALNLVGTPTLVPALVLAAAMGAENAIFERDGKGVNLTFMTGTLVAMARGIAARIRGRDSASWRQPLLMWLSLAGGAVLGALTFSVIGLSAPAVALAVVLAAAFAVYRMGE
ncbi:MAG: YoaK family protein [Rhodococcus sp. (in: high G+C Gram-positive bacteria)]